MNSRTSASASSGHADIKGTVEHANSGLRTPPRPAGQNTASPAVSFRAFWWEWLGVSRDANRRATWAADHFPPRAARMPRSSNPAAMARRDSQPAACSSWTMGMRSVARARAFSCLAATAGLGAPTVNFRSNPTSGSFRGLTGDALVIPAYVTERILLDGGFQRWQHMAT
jgi:hypothetical protein